MSDLSKIFLFRMVHIENVPHILKHGVTHKNSINANKKFVPIGSESIIMKRTTFRLENGKKMGDYIPFYFWGRMPMLYVIQNGFSGVTATKASKIVYCVTNVQQILDFELECVFSDGHGIDSFSTFYDHASINKIEKLLDFHAIKSKYWNNEKDLDFKRKKEAKFLVGQDIPIKAILKFVVFNETAKQELIAHGVPDGKIVIKTDFYF